ncbi:MAG: hypothetical protein M1835_006500 [Candelina submexicana]|nr:MAG: hypothetical protein M1835_006500 [Candelina submexicana]
MPTPPSRSRSQSRSPRRDERRQRSRSPRRQRSTERPRKSTGSGGGGFRWKDKRRRDNEEGRGGEDGDKRLERGYSARQRSRSPFREERGEKDGKVKKEEEKRDRKEKKERKEAAPVPTGEPMIIVNVNDRLGTKAAIPCLASDPIKLFKAQVAARIGRQPHEILLKRQGERPFKDQLTLEDYGVSNGVQLDLELDTGD